MTDYSELKRLAERIREGSGLQGMNAEEAMFNFECAATPAAADARLGELLERVVEHLEYDAIGSPSEAIAGDLAKELRALLARSESKRVKS